MRPLSPPRNGKRRLGPSGLGPEVPIPRCERTSGSAGAPWKKKALSRKPNKTNGLRIIRKSRKSRKSVSKKERKPEALLYGALPPLPVGDFQIRDLDLIGERCMPTNQDPLWDDICETLLSLAKARPAPRRRAHSSRRGAHRERMRAAARLRPPALGTMAARALAAFVPGAWLSMQDVHARIGARPWLVAPTLYSRLWRHGWVEQIDDPEAEGRPIPGKGPRGPRKLWRLTALGEAVRAAALEGVTQAGTIEQRPLTGIAENPWRRKPAPKKKPWRKASRRDL
ncbi:hypothetical protein BOSEA31B_11351 [Hyphomicrobiales bacterium]|nr:hypothetical protein BOSEA31B_11351 [Hyphomicrobiales bacterium]CAH1697144.1 hypothetical protein BOSEA1005_10181 [Hyphomicrobiales bacterium]CAI0342712.1 hypothetical protein BO1005MUT1_10005 [Hyphomicrobiales bacterium]